MINIFSRHFNNSLNECPSDPKWNRGPFPLLLSPLQYSFRWCPRLYLNFIFLEIRGYTCASSFFQKEKEKKEQCTRSTSGKAFPGVCPVILAPPSLRVHTLLSQLTPGPWFTEPVVYHFRGDGAWENGAYNEIPWNSQKLYSKCQTIHTMGAKKSHPGKVCSHKDKLHVCKNMFFHRGGWIATDKINSFLATTPGRSMKISRTILCCEESEVTRLVFLTLSRQHAEFSHNSIPGLCSLAIWC